MPHVFGDRIVILPKKQSDGTSGETAFGAPLSIHTPSTRVMFWPYWGSHTDPLVPAWRFQVTPSTLSWRPVASTAAILVACWPQPRHFPPAACWSMEICMPNTHSSVSPLWSCPPSSSASWQSWPAPRKRQVLSAMLDLTTIAVPRHRWFAKVYLLANCQIPALWRTFSWGLIPLSWLLGRQVVEVMQIPNHLFLGFQCPFKPSTNGKTIKCGLAFVLLYCCAVWLERFGQLSPAHLLVMFSLMPLGISYVIQLHLGYQLPYNISGDKKYYNHGKQQHTYFDLLKKPGKVNNSLQ